MSTKQLFDYRLRCDVCGWRWEPLLLPPIHTAGDRCRNPVSRNCTGAMRKGWT